MGTEAQSSDGSGTPAEARIVPAGDARVGSGDLAPRVIAIFADGTGNSSSELFKTNVWRLYEALDIAGPVENGDLRQIAFYHNGVGTSSFRPLAIVGGAFGVGLKRNIIDLYTFICRVYRPGDHIYLFGFSRGAYTVRVLAGLILDQGLVADTGDRELQMYARDAYRQFRRQFNQTGGLVTMLRGLRDGIINTWRSWTAVSRYTERKVDAAHGNRETAITFIGVWDTVAAYGTPIAELTRGIDDWIWPLSMPNYQLSPRVTRGRHALALDDERDTFHPLLWDERGETNADHVKQMWFAGMHSDVGGGYPDDSLSYVSLEWMLREAAAPNPQADTPGLRFRPEAIAEIERKKDACGPLHDSRRGVGGYYRYQPRKISARMNPPDPTTLLMQDPDPRTGALLSSVQIHKSVLDRIADSCDRYAPGVLPGDYASTSHHVEIDPQARAANQELVWDWIWHKRVNYFLTVMVSVALAGLPLWQLYTRPAACVGVQCLLSPVIELAGAMLPGLAQPWIQAFAKTPGVFASGIILLVLLLVRSSSLQTTIRDNMRAFWERSLQLPRTAPITPAEPWVRRFRSHRFYQKGFQKLKWWILPMVFGLSSLLLLLGVGLAGIGVGVIRSAIWIAEFSNTECSAAPSKPPFLTANPCWRLPVEVEKGKRYRVALWPDPQVAWRDLTIDATPRGFGASEMSFIGNIFTPIRRSWSGRWFQPMVKIVPGKGEGRFQILALEMQRADTPDVRYVAQFTAPRSGSLYMFVNDVLLPPWLPKHRFFYDNNAGVVTDVRVEAVD